MKKILFLMTLLVVGVSFAFAQTNADIKFDKTTHDFGKFSENSPVVSCVFTFTNIGDAPLVIHQAVASCGCTVPEYTKELITEQVNIRDTSKSRLPCVPTQKPKWYASISKAI